MDVEEVVFPRVKILHRYGPKGFLLDEQVDDLSAEGRN